MQINAVEECNWIYPFQRVCINAKEEEMQILRKEDAPIYINITITITTTQNHTT
jgi:hypothetical protein